MSCEKCGKPATFRCPKCAEVGLPPALFCTQDCFKAAWKTHKARHELVAQLRAAAAAAAAEASPASSSTVDDRFAGFTFTGPLRPGKLSPKRTVPEHILRPDYATHPEGKSACEEHESAGIEVKSPEAIAGMREACRVAREVLDEAARAVRPGVTTDEIDRIVHEATIARGAYPSPLGYYGFPKSVCTSVNEVICHGIPDDRQLQNGDIVNLDVTCFYKGFHGDLNETYPVGDVDEAGKQLIQTTYESLEKAIAIVRPGAKYRDIGEVISHHAQGRGYGVVRAFCGHGIGRLFHANPSVPHYAHNKAFGTMASGHTFTIEPMINEHDWHDHRWPDDWTSTTRDGARSAQFEHTLLVTEHGVDVLTARTANSFPYWFLEERAKAGKASAPTKATAAHK